MMSFKKLSNNKYKISLEFAYDILGNRKRICCMLPKGEAAGSNPAKCARITNEYNIGETKDNERKNN